MRELVFFIIGFIFMVNCINSEECYGCPMPVPTNDSGVINAAEWAVEELHGHLNKVLSATRQLVAGLLYTIILNMSKNDEVVSAEDVWRYQVSPIYNQSTQSTVRSES